MGLTHKPRGSMALDRGYPGQEGQKTQHVKYTLGAKNSPGSAGNGQEMRSDKFTKPIDIKFSTVGDPLASHIYRAFVKEYVPLPTHTFTLSTNGLLIKKHLDDSKLLPAIKYFSISVDAGSADVYHNVRRPGKWSVLLENLDYLKDKKKNVGLNFCVQKSNYKDIPKFVELCSEYGQSTV